jgi:hypothetical protein
VGRLVRLSPDMDIRRRAVSDHRGEEPTCMFSIPGFRGYSRPEDLLKEETFPDGLVSRQSSAADSKRLIKIPNRRATHGGHRETLCEIGCGNRRHLGAGPLLTHSANPLR